MRIKISWAKGEITGTLNDTQTARKIYLSLPFSSRANLWGKEVYFTIPVSDDLSPDARRIVDPGTICFWVEGTSLAIPFGPTPIADGDECKLVTKVNIVGKCDGKPEILESISTGDIIKITKR
ncbi:MAG: hypothetical protein JW881_09145 [Spirochaetales bacterium]|nr:hypothetical protein [Spirochaetales bacterium]